MFLFSLLAPNALCAGRCFEIVRKRCFEKKLLDKLLRLFCASPNLQLLEASETFRGQSQLRISVSDKTPGKFLQNEKIKSSLLFPKWSVCQKRAFLQLFHDGFVSKLHNLLFFLTDSESDSIIRNSQELKVLKRESL